MRESIGYKLMLLLILVFPSCKTTQLEIVEGIKVELFSKNKYFHYEDGFVRESKLHEYYFDEEGKIKKIIQPNIDQYKDGFDKVWENIERRIDYDSFGNVISIKTYGYNVESNKELYKDTKIKYIEKEDLISVINYNYANNRNYSYKINIGEKDLKIESADSVVMEKYLFDENNRVIQYIHRYKKSHVELISEVLTSYEEDTVKIYSKKHDSKSEIIYDDENNVVKRRNFQDNQLISLQEFNYATGFIKSSKIIGYPHVFKMEDGEDVEVFKSKSYNKYKVTIGKEISEGNEELKKRVNKQILRMGQDENSKSYLVFRVIFSKH